MALRTGAPMPELIGATTWRNGEMGKGALAGSPVLIHFWSLSCSVCKDNLPRLTEWKAKYGPHGLKVVAVHMPREEEETDLSKVVAALEQFGITEPCAIDNKHTLTQAFGNHQAWVPYYFLFDSDGSLKSRGAGQAAADVLQDVLERRFSKV